jgi:hypothetical protein
MEGRITVRAAASASASVAASVAAWEKAAATHVSVNTMRAGLGGVDGHIAVLSAVADAVLKAR